MDTSEIFRHGAKIAQEYHRTGAKIGNREIMWALVCEAFRASRHYSAPPRSGYPGKSAMPDAPDEVTYWQRVMAALRGEGDMPEAEEYTMPSTPSAADFTRAEIVLRWFHEFALAKAGRRTFLRKVVMAKAAGASDARVRQRSGLTKHQILRAKRRAMDDMLEGLHQLHLLC